MTLQPGIVPFRPPAPMPFVLDTFSGAAGGLLSARNGELGADWTKGTGWAGEFVITAAGRARASVNFGLLYASGVPASPDYAVEADFHVPDLSGTSRIIAICLRQQTAAQTAYLAEMLVNAGVGQWRLRKIVAGAASLIDDIDAGGVSVGATYRLRVEAVGTALRVLVDGAEIIAVNDASIVAAGRPGVFAQNITPTSDAEGIHLDNFRAYDL